MLKKRRFLRCWRSRGSYDNPSSNTATATYPGSNDSMNGTDDDVVDHAEGAAKDEVDDEDDDDSVDRREKWSEADDDRTK